MKTKANGEGSWEVPGSAANVQLSSDPICNSAGCTQYLHPKAEDDHPKNYPVPDFGVDAKVLDSLNSIETAEGIVGKKWTWKEYKKPAPVVYETRPLDGDIVVSLGNLKT